MHIRDLRKHSHLLFSRSICGTTSFALHSMNTTYGILACSYCYFYWWLNSIIHAMSYGLWWVHVTTLLLLDSVWHAPTSVPHAVSYLIQCVQSAMFLPGLTTLALTKNKRSVHRARWGMDQAYSSLKSSISWALGAPPPVLMGCSFSGGCGKGRRSFLGFCSSSCSHFFWHCGIWIGKLHWKSWLLELTYTLCPVSNAEF